MLKLYLLPLSSRLNPILVPKCSIVARENALPLYRYDRGSVRLRFTEKKGIAKAL
jgi:hypothetical protein